MKDDLISRKAVIKALKSDYKDCIADLGEGQLIAIGLEGAIDIVRDIQAEDAAPVVHGQWIFDGGNEYADHYHCSKCGAEIDLCNEIYTEQTPNYCQNCGAKMSKEDA